MACLSLFDNCVVTSAARKQYKRGVRVGEKKGEKREAVCARARVNRETNANELREALNHEHGTDSGLLETRFSP